MVLSAKLASIEGLSEELQKEYKKQDDGSFLLDVGSSDDGYELANTVSLNSTVKTVRKERDSIQEKLKVYDGLNAEDAREAIKKVAEIEEGKYNFDKDEAFLQRVEKERKKLTDKHTDEMKKSTDENISLSGQVRTIFVDNVATQMIADKKANVELLLPHMVKRLKADKGEDGIFHTVVLDKDGDIDRDATGNLVPKESLMEEMEKKFPEAFPGPGSSGSGDKGGEGGGSEGAVSRDDQNAMNNNLEGIASGKVTVTDS